MPVEGGKDICQTNPDAAMNTVPVFCLGRCPFSIASVWNDVAAAFPRLRSMSLAFPPRRVRPGAALARGSGKPTASRVSRRRVYSLSLFLNLLQTCSGFWFWFWFLAVGQLSKCTRTVCPPPRLSARRCCSPYGEPPSPHHDCSAGGCVASFWPLKYRLFLRCLQGNYLDSVVVHAVCRERTASVKGIHLSLAISKILIWNHS